MLSDIMRKDYENMKTSRTQEQLADEIVINLPFDRGQKKN